MSRANIAPRLGETKESIRKSFQWWEAEMDRAAWEDDNVPENVMREQEERWKKLIEEMELAWWLPGDINKPYHGNKTTWKSKSTTLQK